MLFAQGLRQIFLNRMEDEELRIYMDIILFTGVFILFQILFETTVRGGWL